MTTWSVLYFYYLISKNGERPTLSRRRPSDIGPLFQAKLSNYKVCWLDAQCDTLKSKKGKVLAEAVDEWLVRHSDETILSRAQRSRLRSAR